MHKTNQKISIVTTLYKSENYVKEFYERVEKAVCQITSNFEVVFIDDGSPDNSAAVARCIEGPVRVVEFSRNFGHHRAMMAACKYADGDFVFLIDSDLEEPPELLVEFWEEMNLEGELDVCYGVQKKRKGKFVERVTGDLFYKFFNFFSDVKLAPNLLTVRLMSKRYVEALLSHEEKEIFIAGLWEISGFNQKPIVVKKSFRGETTYLFSKKISLILNSITSFSKKPLYLMFSFSVLLLMGVTFYSLFVIYVKLTTPNFVLGYTSLLLSIWLFGGLILLAISVVGIYVSKLFVEVKNRPLYIVKSISDKTG